MNLGKFVFAQVIEHLHAFHRCVARYSGKHKVKRFSSLDQYLSQLTYRESVRDIEACLCVQSQKLFHLGFAAGEVTSVNEVEIRGVSEAAISLRHWLESLERSTA